MPKSPSGLPRGSEGQSEPSRHRNRAAEQVDAVDPRDKPEGQGARARRRGKAAPVSLLPGPLPFQSIEGTLMMLGENSRPRCRAGDRGRGEGASAHRPCQRRRTARRTDPGGGEDVERATGLALIDQSWRLVLDRWPRSGTVPLARHPVREVISVTAYGSEGEAWLVDAGTYQVDVLTAGEGPSGRDAGAADHERRGDRFCRRLRRGGDGCAGYAEAGHVCWWRIGTNSAPASDRTTNRFPIRRAMKG